MQNVIKISAMYCIEIRAVTEVNYYCIKSVQLVPVLLLYFFMISATPELGQVSIFYRG
jgi:hypothetical protein